jgi:hypothetical protein
MITDALNWILTGPAGAAVTGIIGAQNGTGVFAGQAPSGQSNPYVVVEQIAGESEQTLDGPTGRQYVRFKFSCYGKFTESKQLARAVRQALERFTGLCPDGTQFDNAQTVLEGDTFESAPYQYVTSPELAITYVDPTF